MTQLMDALKLGDTLAFKGPKGRFRYSRNMKKHIGASPADSVTDQEVVRATAQQASARVGRQCRASVGSVSAGRRCGVSLRYVDPKRREGRR
jgi:NAD(P)H-flavin reductase